MDLSTAATIANRVLDNTDLDPMKFDPQQLREAIRHVLGTFLEISNCTIGHVDITIADTAYVFSLPTYSSARFLPSRVITDSVWTTPSDGSDPHKIRVRDFRYVRDLKLANPSDTVGRIEYLAFRMTEPRYTDTSEADGWVSPPSDGGDTIAIDFYELLAPLNDDGDAINIPDHFIRSALYRGLPPVLLAGINQSLVQMPGWLAFENWARGTRLPFLSNIIEKDETLIWR